VLSVLDGFCGCGGNTLSLARHFPGATVLAVDCVPSKLALVRANARVYGVEGSVQGVAADVYDVLEWAAFDLQSSSSSSSSSLLQSQQGQGQGQQERRWHFDLVTMSPPWGGPSYLHQAPFYNLDALPSGPCSALARAATAVAEAVVLLLPRNSDPAQLREMVVEAEAGGLGAFVEEICLHGKHKLTALYLGAAFRTPP